jgi:hypothetical protein
VLYCGYHIHFEIWIAILKRRDFLEVIAINTLNTELNPICHLLALLGAHHILHVSRIRVNGRIILECILKK